MLATDFDLKALFAALDQQRAARGLTWPGAAREIAGALPSALVRPVASSTIRTLPRGFPVGPIPELPASRVLRFHTRKVHPPTYPARHARDLAWQQVGDD